MSILIAGSMDATPAMLAYARRVVWRAAERGEFVIVGDNPRGVDAAVLETLHTYRHVDPLMYVGRVYGVGTSLRCEINSEAIATTLVSSEWTQRLVTVHGNPGFKYVNTAYQKHQVTGREVYTRRDRVMCQDADMGMFIWNGRSRGTREGFEYMRSLGKPCWLWENGRLVKGGKHEH